MRPLGGRRRGQKSASRTTIKMWLWVKKKTPENHRCRSIGFLGYPFLTHSPGSRMIQGKKEQVLALKGDHLKKGVYLIPKDFKGFGICKGVFCIHRFSQSFACPRITDSKKQPVSRQKSADSTTWLRERHSAEFSVSRAPAEAKWAAPPFRRRSLHAWSHHGRLKGKMNFGALQSSFYLVLCWLIHWFYLDVLLMLIQIWFVLFVFCFAGW